MQIQLRQEVLLRRPASACRRIHHLHQAAEGAPADVHLRHDVQYSVRVYENDDGSITLKVEQPVEYTNTDSVAADVSQDGFKQVAEAAGVQETARKSKLNLDDDIPF